MFSVARPDLAVTVALAVSLVLHGAVDLWVKVRGPGLESPSPQPIDVWSGRGVEVAAPEVDTVSISEPAAEQPTPIAEPDLQTVPVEPACVSNCAPAEPKPVT